MDVARLLGGANLQCVRGRVEDQGAVPCITLLHGEADAADTANGAEPEDDAERREESSDTDSGDGGR